MISKNPMIASAFAEVVIDGALIDVDFLWTFPPWASIGFEVSTPAYARIPPAAASEVENVHVWLAGSDAVATLSKAARVSLVPFTSVRIRVQPAGAVIVGAPRTATVATMTSPG